MADVISKESKSMPREIAPAVQKTALEWYAQKADKMKHPKWMFVGAAHLAGWKIDPAQDQTSLTESAYHAGCDAFQGMRIG